MTFSPEQIADLQKKLDPSHIAKREQSGKQLSYVEGWHVIAEANRIFGFDAWNRETVTLLETSRDLVHIKGYQGKPDYDQWRVSYLARVRITVGDIIREGTGYGSGMAKPEALGDAIESAAKEAETDAMKRALMTFGNPFGLALYDKSHANVEQPEPKQPPAPAQSATPVSAARMKEGLKAIEDDLLDCHMITDVDKCAKIWAAIMKRDGWSKDYRDIAAPKFQARRDVITKAAEAAEVFPGDPVHRNPNIISTLQAG